MRVSKSWLPVLGAAVIVAFVLIGAAIGLSLTRLPGIGSELGFPLIVLIVVAGSSLVRWMLPPEAMPVRGSRDRARARQAAWVLAAILCAVVAASYWFGLS